MRRYTIEVNGTPFSIDVQELSADRFEVTVEDQRLEVQLTGEADLSEGTITPAMGAPAPAPAPARSATPAPHPYSSGAPPAPLLRALPSGGGARGDALTAPLPGTIASIAVGAGQSVERGDVLLTLEAMKMKNAIRAPRAVTISEVCVEPGQSVGHGDVLVRFVGR